MALDGAFLDQIGSANFVEQLFAALPDVVFCIKDSARCYRCANAAFAARLGFKDSRSVIGRRADEFFPADLAATYLRQDQQVLQEGRPIVDELELITDSHGKLGWYLATKTPLHDRNGTIIGLASISRDLRSPGANEAEIEGIARVAEYVRNHLAEPINPVDLAKIAGMSPTQLDRRMRRVYQLSTARFIRKARIGYAADQLIHSEHPIAEIALDCGYGDQTALTRQFRATVGMPPAAFRTHARLANRG